MHGFSRQPLAQRGRQIAHRAEIESPLGVQRVINLRPAIARLAQRFQQRAQFFLGFSKQISTGVRALLQPFEFMITREELPIARCQNGTANDTRATGMQQWNSTMPEYISHGAEGNSAEWLGGDH